MQFLNYWQSHYREIGIGIEIQKLVYYNKSLYGDMDRDTTSQYREIVVGIEIQIPVSYNKSLIGYMDSDTTSHYCIIRASIL